jgi:hypothetical protein
LRLLGKGVNIQRLEAWENGCEMVGLLRKAWSDPVWSKVIAAGIIGAAGSYFLGWWSGIGWLISAIFGFLGRTTPVWNWLIGAVSLVAILCTLELWLQDRSAKKRAAAVPLYTKDEFFDVEWRWQFGHGKITDLYSFCTKCGLQVYARDMGGYAAVPRVGFPCEDCGKIAGPFEGTDSSVENQVIRLVQRNMRDRAARGTLL